MVGAVQEVRELNGFDAIGYEYDRTAVMTTKPPRAEEEKWYEEEIDDDLKLCYKLNSVLHRGTSKYQEIALIDTKHFGKALIIDGKMQSAEVDEFIYHESLVHPPLLFHPNPKTVFIMGGGEGSAAREVLRHNTVQRVVMCDIDEEVVDFCRTYLSANWAAFASDKLCLIINDARHLEKSREKFDVIVGDLADPMEGGPCYQLYTKSFYEHVVKPKLTDRGIFVTQAQNSFSFTAGAKERAPPPDPTTHGRLLSPASVEAPDPPVRPSSGEGVAKIRVPRAVGRKEGGAIIGGGEKGALSHDGEKGAPPSRWREGAVGEEGGSQERKEAGPAGVLTHREVFSSIYNTLRHVFKYVKAYTAHVPSFADTWGWVMASDHPFNLSAHQIDERIKERLDTELLYLSGESLISSTTLNKSVYKSLQNETHVYTEDDARFIHGHGRAHLLT
ncbi:hypothetical protein PR202_gb06698 [Eleusine coracana subsp. coracana]|uniref:thermospermine synthase n=1 Tax=Eleusine coracana subsp. coracana TaxID=191504 RepID=A0AAV5EAZ8_ELECO|nr:hypothetical protein PR202_gb06698 [Eleusine coracana subsp. coracana]